MCSLKIFPGAKMVNKNIGRKYNSEESKMVF